jgi:hypothetical protein
MIERGIGISVLPGLAVHRREQNMTMKIITLNDEWAVRRPLICAREFKALPGFSASLISLLLEDVPKI